MGSAGHKFIAHTKSLSPRAQNNGAGYGLPPHPLAVRPGQRFWPRSGTSKRELTVRAIKGDRIVGRHDGATAAVTVARSRLLLARDDGQGRWFQFQGFVSRRYPTVAHVHAVDERLATLCVPEWHPRRPVRIFRALLPAHADVPGAWLTLVCDLSAPSAARLQPARLAVAEPPSPAAVHAPQL
jgi:hypothetical protein